MASLPDAEVEGEDPRLDLHPNDVDWGEAPVVFVKVPRPFGVTACRRSGVHPMPEGSWPYGGLDLNVRLQTSASSGPGFKGCSSEGSEQRSTAERTELRRLVLGPVQSTTSSKRRRVSGSGFHIMCEFRAMAKVSISPWKTSSKVRPINPG